MPVAARLAEALIFCGGGGGGKVRVSTLCAKAKLRMARLLSNKVTYSISSTGPARRNCPCCSLGDQKPPATPGEPPGQSVDIPCHCRVGEGSSHTSPFKVALVRQEQQPEILAKEVMAADWLCQRARAPLSLSKSPTELLDICFSMPDRNCRRKKFCTRLWSRIWRHYIVNPNPPSTSAANPSL